MKRFLLLICLFSLNLCAQSKLDFEFDYAQFAYDSTSNYVEFFYSFNQATLQDAKLNKQSSLKRILKIFLQDTAKGDTIINNQWSVNYEVGIDSSHNNQTLVGTISFIIPFGFYNCVVIGSDVNDDKNFRRIDEAINVRPILTNDISMSDIQVASRIIQDSQDTSSIFYKNSFEVIPMPSLVFSRSQPVLFFYSELYNLKSDSTLSSDLTLLQILADNKGNKIKEKIKRINKLVDTRVEVGSFVLSTYPSGVYTLVISLIDSSRNKSLTSSKKFFVYNPDVQIIESSDLSGGTVLGSSFGSMSEEEIDDLMDKSKYLATSFELEKYKKITTLDGKREFLNEFWKNKDDDPTTPGNHFFKTYLKNIEICNSRYKSMGKPGWKTDRGRIFLIYGDPSEIDRYPNETETKPYEVWRYSEIEGGVEFVFADITGFADYTLVHSTKRGELRDDNWSRRILVR